MYKKQNRTRPFAGKPEVIYIAEQLMQKYSETTTLDVKRELRQLGYIAYQADISYFMKLAAAEKGWAFTCNGRNRTYKLVPRAEWLEKLLAVCLN